MAKRAADTELLHEETKSLRIQPRDADPLMAVVRAAYVTAQGDLSDRPITLITIDEDAQWKTMFYWVRDEAIGLRVLKLLMDPAKDAPVDVVNALMCLALSHYRPYMDADQEKLLCETFAVKEVHELGVFGELATAYLNSKGRRQMPTGNAFAEESLNPSRCTIVMHCYE